MQLGSFGYFLPTEICIAIAAIVAACIIFSDIDTGDTSAFRSLIFIFACPDRLACNFRDQTIIDTFTCNNSESTQIVFFGTSLYLDMILRCRFCKIPGDVQDLFLRQLSC